MLISKAVLALGLGAFVFAATPARADSAMPQPAVLSATAPLAGVITVADGCGYGWYRGPGGYCHPFGSGPYPGGYYGPYPGSYDPQPPAYGWNGCPVGYWRGPWGHCRNTPYHGRLPDGSWQ